MVSRQNKAIVYNSDGARHLWRLIKYLRYLTHELRGLVEAVIQKNGYFGHSENILQATPG